MLAMVSLVRWKGLRTNRFSAWSTPTCWGRSVQRRLLFHISGEKRAGLFINTTSIGGLVTVPFNSIYHATKWALEGWSESMAFELSQFGIGIKTIEPGGMKTDFFTRSFDTGRHPAYDALVNKVMGIITDPKQMATYSSPEQIAEVVYEAATDGKDQLRYVAGADAKAMYAMRLQLGDEAFRKAIAQQFFGDAQKAA